MVFWETSSKQSQCIKTKARVNSEVLKYQALFVCVLRYYYPHFRIEEIETQYQVAGFLEHRFPEIGLLSRSTNFKIFATY